LLGPCPSSDRPKVKREGQGFRLFVDDLRKVIRTASQSSAVLGRRVEKVEATRLPPAAPRNSSSDSLFTSQNLAVTVVGKPCKRGAKTLAPLGFAWFAGLLLRTLPSVGALEGRPRPMAGPAADAITVFQHASKFMNEQDEKDSQNEGGRPRKPESERRSLTHGLRLSPDEKEELEQRAERAGLNLSEYIRRRALGEEIQTEVEEEAIRQIRRAGVNLNQIAKWANEGKDKAVHSAAKSTIQEVKEAIRQLL
jgi:hypothetical protein